MKRKIDWRVAAALALLAVAGCGRREKARIELDFSKAAEWRYMIGADIYGASTAADTGQYFSGSFRAYLQGLPGNAEDGPLRCGFTDVNLIASFLSEEERSDLVRRISELRVSVSENGVTLSDTAGIPGVMSGGWDILRAPARVIPAMPNADMTVGSSWEREQRFPLSVTKGEAEGHMYQLYTLDSLFRNDAGVRVAAISWVFSYRVATKEEKDEGPRKRMYPLSGSGRGNAELDVARKKLIKSQATFQVTHSGMTGMEINEVAHFEVLE
ncbi:MAG: hypothetical protein LBB74_02180 [Chitinispirillales bacterium]|nr:hypothetical protein [Chitinispirillales bacterium]